MGMAGCYIPGNMLRDAKIMNSLTDFVPVDRLRTSSRTNHGAPVIDRKAIFWIASNRFQCRSVSLTPQTELS